MPLYSFLPAKPGAGCSTTAIHSALELAQRQSQRVLLADFDLNCGLTRFFLKIDHPYSCRDAVRGALNDEIWQRLRVRVDDLDVLPNGAIDLRPGLEPEALGSFLEFVRQRYRYVVADLSGTLEPFSLDILRESHRILLVVEPELSSLHMAQEKIQFLEAFDLASRVALVGCKWHADLPVDLGDVEVAVCEAENQIRQSLLRGGALDPASPYFKDISRLVDHMSVIPLR
jgi:Flp pilus assembly CpaE family ATPase